MTSEREAELLTACKQVEHDRRAVYEDDVRYPGVLGTFQEPPSVHIPIAELRDLLATAARERRMREALISIAGYDSGNGCCPHGCDTPTIAKAGLLPPPQEPSK